jgi:hypothetical protein
VCRFLEIDDTVAPDLKHQVRNSRRDALARMTMNGRGKASVDTHWTKETRQWVTDQIREDNCRFLAHFGRPRNHWGDLF